jgi:hypothetical protein
MQKRATAKGAVVSSRSLMAIPDDNDMKSLKIVGKKGNPVDFSHWSFGQAAQLAGAPPSYLRDLPAPIAADCINYGLHHNRKIEDVGIYLGVDYAGYPTEMRAITGPSYGRIYNADITSELVKRFGDGVTGDWKVPGEFGVDVPVTKANTTLFASDRDMFVFLADEKNRIEIPNRRAGKMGTFARGVFMWNSEVGSASIGAAFFLFDYTCCNRIVWGATDYKEIRLRHSVSAPDKWLDQVTPILVEYSEASAMPIIQTIEAAQAKKVDNVQEFLRNRFSKSQSFAIAKTFEEEEGKPIESLWDVTTGITAYAKTIPNTNERVVFEREGGKVLDSLAS